MPAAEELSDIAVTTSMHVVAKKDRCQTIQKKQENSLYNSEASLKVRSEKSESYSNERSVSPGTSQKMSTSPEGHRLTHTTHNNSSPLLLQLVAEESSHKDT